MTEVRMVAPFQYKCAEALFPDWLLSNCFYFLCKRLYARKGGRSHVCMRCTWPIKRREVIGSVSTNCYFLKHNTKVWPFPEVYASDGGELVRASSLWSSSGDCVCSSPQESLLAGHVMVSILLFPDCNAKKCHDEQTVRKNLSQISSCIRNSERTKRYLDAVRRNRSLQTIGISWKHVLVFFRTI